jgi:4,5-DOPA dioxygenase extradiol
MKNQTIPPIFISHGAPTLIMEDIPAKNFLIELGSKYKDVKAVLCISSHWETSHPSVNLAKNYETIHDFYGFPDELYQIQYPAQGSAALSERVAELLEKSYPRDVIPQRGLDHGAWVPLKLMFPDADIPVAQLSIQHSLNPAEHMGVGRAISELKEEGILILGSGGAVHPLGYASFRFGADPDAWALEFEEWLTKAIATGNEKDLINYRTISPYPERAHPRPDHLMPLMTVFGAAGKTKGKKVHGSWYAGDLGMGAYIFEE